MQQQLHSEACIRQNRRFNKVNIEISNICNLQCSFCPPVEREKKMMSLETFQSVISQVAPLTDQVTLHLMGDPLVHPKLAEFLGICSEYQVPVFFVSNGVLMNDLKAELLLNPIIRQVNFSLHSFHDNYGDKDPTIYLNKITCKGNQYLCVVTSAISPLPDSDMVVPFSVMFVLDDMLNTAVRSGCACAIKLLESKNLLHKSTSSMLALL